MLDTDHMMLVGGGALKFAKAEGFKEEDLLTEESPHRVAGLEAGPSRQERAQQLGFGHRCAACRAEEGAA